MTFKPPAPGLSIVSAAANSFAQERVVERASLTLAALVELFPARTPQVAGEKLEALATAADDDDLPGLIALLQAVPRLWESLGTAQQARLVRYVGQLPGPHLRNTLPLAWEVVPLKQAVLDRIAIIARLEWPAIGSPPFPREWLDAVLGALDGAANFADANAIIKRVLIPAFSQLTAVDLGRIANAAAQNSQVRGSIELLSLLRRFRDALGTDRLAAALAAADSGLVDYVKDESAWWEGGTP